MQNIKKLDLHMHSVVSDGTDTPGEILSKVKASGIDMFSITDHDAIKGCITILDCITGDDPKFITGAEFSCRDEEGKYHILGYNYDPNSKSIQDVVDLGHGYRMKKVMARLDYIKESYGFDFSKEDIDNLLSLPNPGKPHIGNLMVKYGYAPSKEEAINKYINGIRFKSEYVRPEEAIQGILESGGIPVLAHPPYGSGDQLILGEEMEDRLKRLMDFGIKGVEGFYSGFTPKLCQMMLRLAEKYDLYVTAGSDYHGRNKLVILGDNNLPEKSEWPKGLTEFIKKVIL